MDLNDRNNIDDEPSSWGEDEEFENIDNKNDKELTYE